MLTVEIRRAKGWTLDSPDGQLRMTFGIPAGFGAEEVGLSPANLL